MDPSQPENVAPLNDPPNETVNADGSTADNKAQDALDQTAAKTETNSQDANNNLSTSEKSEVFNKAMLGVMALGSFVGMSSSIISVLTFIENKAKGQTGTYPPGANTPQKQKQIDDDITTWLGLSDEETWSRLYYTVEGKHDPANPKTLLDPPNPPLNYQQQLVLLNFIGRTRPMKGTWTWDAATKWKLIVQLSQDFDDWKMYSDVWVYQYNKQHLPFSVGVAVVEAALTHKYSPS